MENAPIIGMIFGLGECNTLPCHSAYQKLE